MSSREHITISQYSFADAAYENALTGWTAGGYIFIARMCYSDGGEFTLMQKTRSGDSILYDEFEKTAVKIPCQELEKPTQYLIDTCTTGEMSFFQKLDAVQERLEEIAVYPRKVWAMDIPNKRMPYPALAISPYPELSLNEHYNMYATYRSGMLADWAYPFVLDSFGFPGIISTIAKMLEPACKVSSGHMHSDITVSFNGETRTYGGAGEGGYVPIRSDRVNGVFTFRAGAALGPVSTMEDCCAKLKSCQAVAEKDMAPYIRSDCRRDLP